MLGWLKRKLRSESDPMTAPTRKAPGFLLSPWVPLPGGLNQAPTTPPPPPPPQGARSGESGDALDRFIRSSEQRTIRMHAFLESLGVQKLSRAQLRAALDLQAAEFAAEREVELKVADADLGPLKPLPKPPFKEVQLIMATALTAADTVRRCDTVLKHWCGNEENRAFVESERTSAAAVLARAQELYDQMKLFKFEPEKK